MDEHELLAEFTDGVTTLVEPVTEELSLGASHLWCTPEGDDAWYTVMRLEPLQSRRRDGVSLRVHLEDPRRPHGEGE